jgi:hypothetical protein
MLALTSSVTLFYLHRSVKAFTGSYGNVLPYRVPWNSPRIVNSIWLFRYKSFVLVYCPIKALRAFVCVLSLYPAVVQRSEAVSGSGDVFYISLLSYPLIPISASNGSLSVRPPPPLPDANRGGEGGGDSLCNASPSIWTV